MSFDLKIINISLFVDLDLVPCGYRCVNAHLKSQIGALCFRYVRVCLFAVFLAPLNFGRQSIMRFELVDLKVKCTRYDGVV